MKRFTLSLVFKPLIIALLFFSIFKLNGQVVVFSEGFENNSNMPSGWTQEYVYDTLNWSFTSGGNSQNPPAAHSGSYNALLYYGGIYRTTKLVSPAINLIYFSNVTMEFWHAMADYSGDQDYLRVYYKTSSSASWVILDSFKTNTPTWTKRTLNLPNTSGTYFIAFEGEARYGYGVCVDDIAIKGNATNGLDISTTKIDTPVIWKAGTNYLTMRFKNLRSDTIFNADFGYQIDNGTPVRDTNVTLTDTLFTNESQTYRFSSPITMTKGSHIVRVWSTRPNRQNDDDQSNDTLTVSITTGIQDTFYIDKYGNGDYTSFAAAVADLNKGITGPTVFIVRGGIYNERVTLGEIPGANATNNITFDGIHPDSVILTYAGTSASNRATLVFKGGDYITFKNMKIQNTGATYAVAVLFKNNSDYNTFSNCKLHLSTSATGTYTQVVLAVANESSNSALGNNANYNTFINNEIKGGREGVRMYGNGTALLDVGNKFINNTFLQQYYYGMYMYYQKDLEIRNNSITRFRYVSAYAVMVYYSTQTIIDANVIHPGVYGIYLYRENTFYPTNISYITNNMISNFGSSSGNTGIMCYYQCYNMNILHNSIWVKGSYSNQNYAGIRLYYQCNNSVLKNNLISATQNNYLISLYNNSNIEIDYNNYYCDTSATSSKFYNNSVYNSFNAFKNSTANVKIPHDQNSYDNINPRFFSYTNLHLDTNNTPSLLAPYAGVNFDIDGDARGASTGNNLGADEIYHPSRDLDIASIDSPMVLRPGLNTVSVSLRNNGSDSILPQTIYLSYKVDTGSWVNDSLVLTTKLAAFQQVKFSFGTKMNITSTSGFHNICVKIDPQILNDPDATDSMCVSRCMGIQDTFYIDANGNGDFTSFNSAIASINSCGISGQIVFIVRPGNYFENIKFTTYPGVSARNNVIFQGVDKDSVFLIHSGTSTAPATIEFDGADHITVRDITIRNIGASYATGVLFKSIADSNLIYNCDIYAKLGSHYYSYPVLASSSLYYNGYGNNANYNTIEKCFLSGGYYGICFSGSDQNTPNFGNRFIDNIIHSPYYMGMRNTYLSGTEIEGNTITNLGINYGYGIYNYYSTDSKINRNIINPGRVGIYLFRENDVFSQNSTDIINNMISDFGDNSYQAGIYAYYYCNNLNILHNSIWTDGSTANMAYSNITLYNYSDSAVVKNNNLASTSNGMLFSNYLGSGHQIDYNNYYYPNATSYLFYNSGYHTTFAAFKNSTTGLGTHDQNSFDNKYHGFTSEQDLHLSDTSAGIIGTQLNVTIDADKDSRCPNFPTIGADEGGPIANFTINDTVQCFNSHVFQFTNISKTGYDTLSYLWYFGDGDTSSQYSPTHYYSTPGTYTVKLVITPNRGCADSLEKTISVKPAPSASFTTNDTSQCLSGNFFNFTNTSTISTGTMSYYWIFDDGYNATVTSPYHIYPNYGIFDVKLVATSNNGCTDTAFQRVYVNPQPATNFAINNANQCLNGNSFAFTNTTTIGSGQIHSLWYFGDGDTSTLSNPTHSYQNEGTYTVKLVVNSSSSCIDSTTKVVTVNPKPVVDFTINDSSQCLNGNSYSFINSSTISSGYATYEWSFDDGNTDTSTHPSHSYNNHGNYEVKLVASSGLNCNDSMTKTAYVRPMPNAAFNTTYTNLCLGSPVQFNDQSTIANGTLNFLWDFKDGDTSSLQNPSHEFNSAGTYKVLQTVTSDYGCSDTSTSSLTIIPAPVADFSMNDTLQCISGNQFVITNNTTISAGSMNFYWDLGDNTTSTATNITHSYATANSYPVKLVAYSGSNSCADSIIKYAHVLPGPQTNFAINDNSQCLQENDFVFYDSSTGTNQLSTYIWSFGDGDTSHSQTPNHHYSSTGNYSVKLYVSNGNCSDSITKVLQVLESPNASFTLNDTTQCLNGNLFTSTNSSSISSGTLTYLWEYGDNNTSNTNNISYSYNQSDTFSLKLIATTTSGCKDSAIQMVYIHPTPNSDFSIDDSGQCLGSNLFTFTNATSIGSGTFNNQWYFGDNTTSTNLNTSHSYATPDTYTVKLVNESNLGCKDSVSKNVYIIPGADAAFSVNDTNQCLFGNSFVFNNLSNTSATAPIYIWSFGDGNTSNLENPTHSYTSVGQFEVKLIVIPDSGCTDTFSRMVIAQKSPSADFAINDTAQCFNNHIFSFTNNSSVSSGNLTYNWDFGDGTTVTATDTFHSYNAFGSYSVKLITTADNGCADSLTKNVHAFAEPTAGFSINDTAQCFSNHSFTFTNTSAISGGNMSYLWNFGDGNSSNAADTTYNYSTAGNYNILLVATSNNGCIDSFTDHVSVYSSPVSGFTLNDTIQCFNGNSFNTNNTSSISSGSMNYMWYFGDGDTTSAQNPAHAYSNEGNYTIKLLVSTDDGCIDSTLQNVYIYPDPIADFNINDSTQCISGNNFSFTNNSSINAGTISHNWDFGDGNVSVAQNTTHAYASLGTYPVRLTVTSDLGCVDSLTKNVFVQSSPVSGFTINDNTQCLSGNSFVMNNTSSISSGTIDYIWNFGDGDTSNSQNPAHAYQTSGTYTIKLFASSGDGCSDSITRNVTVYPSANVDFVINDTSQCLNQNQFSFTNNTTVSSGTLSYFWDFGNGSTSTQNSPNHIYTLDNNYYVKLKATTTDGCVDSLVKLLHVYPNPNPAVSVNDNSQCLQNNYFEFYDISTLGNQTLTNFWIIDGQGYVQNQDTISYTFVKDTIHNITLISASSVGCKDTTSIQVDVISNPIADFTINDTSQCQQGNSFKFTDVSNFNGSLSNTWLLGDGSSATNKNKVTHSYIIPKRYKVRLIVESNEGCTDTSVQYVRINPKPYPIIYINDETQCLKENNFTFYNNTTLLTGKFSHYWEYGDGDTSTFEKKNHIYQDTGIYTIKYVATSDYGCKDSVIKTVEIDESPVADFTIDRTEVCLNSNKFNTTNQSSISIGTLSYEWQFGDGTNYFTKDATHSYTDPGSYVVKLITSSTNGCKDEKNVTVEVNPMPVAAFSVNKQSQCLSTNNFKFTDNTTISNGFVNLLWNFGDGMNSYDSDSTSHSYNNPGNYTIQLIATSNRGCLDTRNMQVSVVNSPTVNIGPDLTKSYGLVFNLDAGAGYAGYLWYNNLQTQKISINTTNFNNGTYPIWVRVSNNTGCYGYDTMLLTVFGAPNSIEDFAEGRFNIYPNPAREVIYIETDEQVKDELKIELVNMEGKVVYTSSFEQNARFTEIDIRNYARGVYFLRLSTDHNQFMKKVVVY
jgi:PKD repeat protein